MDPRLARFVKDAAERGRFCEQRALRGASRQHPAGAGARRDGRRKSLRPLCRIQSAGAVGLMQVMPFWPGQLGMSNEQLIRIAGQRAHGHDDPRLLPAQGARQLHPRAAALQRQPRAARRTPTSSSTGWSHAGATIELTRARATSSARAERVRRTCDQRIGRARSSTVDRRSTRREAGEPCHSQRHSAVDGRDLAAGEHFDATVRQVARVTRDAELSSTRSGAGTVEHTLHAAGNEAAAATVAVTAASGQGDSAAFLGEPACLERLVPRLLRLVARRPDTRRAGG